jgi:outer membrane protein assembly factor BamC
VNPIPAATPTRLAVLALVAALAGCSTISGWFSSDKADYGVRQPVRSKPLDVPPDLSQLARDSRYEVQGGVISASGTSAAAPAGTVTPTVAIDREGDMRIERDGQMRWLEVPQSPEQLWPKVRDFWEQRGFKLTEDDPKVGLMQTDWTENKAKAPGGLVRKMLGGIAENLFDSGLRDAFRTRIERTATGSNIYIAQHGIEEVWVNNQHDETTWRPRPNDPLLESEMLSRLMLALGGSAPAPGAKVAEVSATPVAPVATGAGGAQPTTLVVDEPFDRAWRRVSLALDRGGFTVEDRDRNAGLFYVRWVDPKNAGKEDPGWWARLWGDHSHPQEALRFRIALKPSGEKTTVTVQNSTGQVDTGDNARRIAGLLMSGLH